MNKTFTSNSNNCNGHVYSNSKRNVGDTLAAKVKVFIFNLIVLASALGAAELVIAHIK